MATPTVTGTVSTGTSSGSILSYALGLTIASGLTGSTLIAISTNPFGHSGTSADWNGVAMNALPLSSGYTWLNAYYLHSPAPGTFNVNFNWGVFSSNVSVIAFAVKDAGNIEQAHDIGGFPTGTSGSQSITTTLVDELLIGMFWNDGGFTQTIGGSQTLLSNAFVGSYRTTVSSLAAPTIGLQTMTTSFSGSANWDSFIIALSAPASGGANNMFLVL